MHDILHSQCISAFVRNGTQVAGIGNLLYWCSDAISYHNRKADEPHFTLPRYALAPTLRLQCVLPTPLPNYKKVLINWALSVVLNHVDMESTRLAECPTFVRKRNERISWDLLLSWWMNGSQEKIANIAPALFAIASTCAVSKEDREQLEEAEKNASNVLPSLPSSNDATPSNAAPTTTPAFDIVSSGVPMTMRSDLWLGVTVAILALLHPRYTYAIIFPILVSILLFSCNANRDDIAMLSRIGVSVAYSTILSGLHVLASGAGTQLRAFGATLGTAAPIFQIPFDNVSKTRPAWQQSLGRRDEVNSGTAATLVQLEDVLPGALEAEPLIE